MSRAKGRTRQGKHKIQYKRKNQNGAVKNARPSSPPVQRSNPKSKTSSKHAIVQARKAKCQTQVQAGVVVKPLSVVKNKTNVFVRHDNLTPFKLPLEHDENVTATTTTPPVVGSPNDDDNDDNKKPAGFLTRLAAFSPMRLMTLKKAPVRRQVLTTRPSSTLLPPMVVLPPPTPHTTPVRASSIVKLWHNNNNQTTQTPFHTPQKPPVLPLATTPHDATAASFAFMPNVMTNTAATTGGIVQTWTPPKTTTTTRRRRRSSMASTPLTVRFAQWNLFANNNNGTSTDDDNNKTPTTPTSKTPGRPF